MKEQTFRLFINNLTESIDEASLKEKLSQFGSVSSVEIKQRKNKIGNQTPAFAYININTSYETLQKCFKDFSTQKFMGTFIDISIAKESFMERLKREREESNKSNNEATKSVISDNFNNHSEKVNGDPFKLKCDTKMVTQDKPNIPMKINNGHNKIKFNGALEIKSVLNSNKEIIEKEPNKPKIAVTLSMSEKKRIQSVLEKKKDYQKQKSTIQKALSNIDMKPKTKITFSEDAETETAPSPTNAKDNLLNEKNHVSQYQSKANKSKVMLFDDDEADESDSNEINDLNFEVKEHFEGAKGQKLLELQSKYKNDKRFTLDARFLEDEPSEKTDEDNKEENEKAVDGTIDEKEKQLQILEQVLGKRIITPKATKESSSSKKLTGMLRFDPDQEDHLKYEIKVPTKEKETKKRKRKDSIDADENDKKRQELENQPQVSTEKFYKVTDKLKSALQSSQQFSLLETFGETPAEEGREMEKEEQSATIIKDKKKAPFRDDFNPFRYDSSTESEDEKEQESESKDRLERKNDDIDNTGKTASNFGSSRFWNESFFFKNDDYRLQEGLDFIKRLEVDEETDFNKLRRSIKEVAKAKVRNNQRKNRQFKRKLGGKKRIKLKRAQKDSTCNYT